MARILSALSTGTNLRPSLRQVNSLRLELADKTVHLLLVLHCCCQRELFQWAGTHNATCVVHMSMGLVNHTQPRRGAAAISLRTRKMQYNRGHNWNTVNAASPTSIRQTLPCWTRPHIPVVCVCAHAHTHMCSSVSPSDDIIHAPSECTAWQHLAGSFGRLNQAQTHTLPTHLKFLSSLTSYDCIGILEATF